LPRSRLCSSSLPRRATPRRAKSCALLGTRRVRGLVGSQQRPSALHDGALQAGVSGSGCPRSRPCSSSLALLAPPRRRSLRWRSSIWHTASGSGCPRAFPACRSLALLATPQRTLRLLGVREVLWARRDVTPLSKLALSKLEFSKPASRAPGAPGPVLLVRSGPPGHASPCSATSWARDVRTASWARCYILPPTTLAFFDLASRAPGAPEPALHVKSGPPGLWSRTLSPAKARSYGHQLAYYGPGRSLLRTLAPQGRLATRLASPASTGSGRRVWQRPFWLPSHCLKG
jgi:hypothetical protein